MTGERTDGHLSDRSLDLLLLSGESNAATKRAREHVQRCESCSHHLDALQQSAERFNVYVRPRTEARVLDRLDRQAAGRRRRSRAWQLSLLGIAAAASWVLVARPAPRSVERPPVELRTKGGPALLVFVRHADQVSRASDGVHVEPGDNLRFTADPSGHAWLLIGSIDSAGRATLYFPYGGRASGPIDPARRFEDDGSIQLDATRGPERIFALFSDRPIAWVDVNRALLEVGARGPSAIRATTNLSFDGAFQNSLLLEK